MVHGEKTRRTIHMRTFERIFMTITETDLPTMDLRTYSKSQIGISFILALL